MIVSRPRTPERRHCVLAIAIATLLAASCGGGGESAPGDDGGADALVADADVATVPPDSDGAGIDAPVDGDVEADVTVPGCVPQPAPAGEVRARRIECEAELLTHSERERSHRAARVGDFVIENRDVHFVVRAGNEGLALLGTTGGSLVDAWPTDAPGAAGDGLRELIPVISLNVLDVEDVSITADGSEGQAVVAVTGRAVPLSLIADVLPSMPIDGVVTVEYVLDPDVDHLVIRTRVAVPEGGRTSMVFATDVIFLTGAMDLFLPGPPRGGGETWKGDFVAAASPDVAYGYLPEADAHFFDMGGSLIFLAPSRPVRPGEELVVERRLVVSTGGVAGGLPAVTASLWALDDVETGLVGVGLAPGTPVGAGYVARAFDADGRALTEFPVAAGGQTEVRLPLGAVDLVVGCDGCDDGPSTTVTVASDAPVDAVLPAPEPGELLVRVRDGDGAAVPARLSVDDLERPTRGRRYFLVGPPPERAFPLPPGRYRVAVTRGFEYEMAVFDDVLVPAGARAELDATLERSVATPDAISAEFHIHSETSADSAVPLPDRVLSCAAEGLDFVVSSDHDVVTDYRPWIAALGLDGLLASIPGVEVSSIDAGHTQAWPMELDPDYAGNGAPVWFGLSPPDLVAAIREGHPERIVQVNHPRFDYGSAFEIIGFDPQTARATVAPETLGFPPEADLSALPYDAIEVFNAIGDEQLESQIADWYALLNDGRRITATGGGDSHDLRAFPGNPRNYVLGVGDDPAALDAAAIADAVRAMRVLVTSGPYVEAGVVPSGGGDPSRPGDVVAATGGEAPLRIRVQAPSWMAVDELVVVANGAVVHTEDLRAVAPDGATRFDGELRLPVAQDTWFVVLVRGAARVPEAAQHAPFAITNPFYVDADDDGAFSAPGLPAR